MFITPFILLFSLAKWGLDYQYHHNIAQDAVQGWAGVANRWIMEKYFIPWINQPGYAYTFQALIQSWLTGISAGSLIPFNNIGQTINFIVIASVALVAVNLLDKSRCLSFQVIAVFSAVVSTMPTMATNLMIGAGGYFISGLLFALLGICFFTICEKHDKTDNPQIVFLTVLGFLCSNYYPALAVFAGYIVFLIISRSESLNKERIISFLKAGAVQLCKSPGILTCAFLTLWGPSKLVESIGGDACLGILVLMVVMFGADVIRLKRCSDRIVSFYSRYFLLGWILGASIFSPWWLRMGIGQFVYRTLGGCATEGKIIFSQTPQQITDIDYSFVLNALPWGGFVLLPIGLSVFFLLRSWRSCQLAEKKLNFACACFLILTVGGILLVGKSTFLLGKFSRMADGCYEFGLNERAMLPILTPVGFAVIWLIYKARKSLVLSGLFLACAIWSGCKFYGFIGDMATRVKVFESDLARIIESRRVVDSKIKIIYIDTYLPESASALNARYGNYGKKPGTYSLEQMINKNPMETEFYCDRNPMNIEYARKLSSAVFVCMESTMPNLDLPIMSTHQLVSDRKIVILAK